MKVVLKHLLDRAMFIGLEVTLLEANIHLVCIEVEWPDLGTAGCALIMGGGFKAGCGGGLRLINQ